MINISSSADEWEVALLRRGKFSQVVWRWPSSYNVMG